MVSKDPGPTRLVSVTREGAPAGSTTLSGAASDRLVEPS